MNLSQHNGQYCLPFLCYVNPNNGFLPNVTDYTLF